MTNPFDQYDEANPFDDYGYSTREAVEMLPDWLTRTPFEKQNDWRNGRGAELDGMNLRGTRGESAAIGAYDGLSLGNYATERSAKALYPTYANMPFLAQGAAELDKRGVLPEWAGGGKAEAQEATLRGFQEQQTAAREENPFSYMGGEVGGYLLPGGGVLNAGSKGVKAGSRIFSPRIAATGDDLA
ncbi:MAG: hypothetical protein AAF194_08830, partial [Pseudomonadota bacterium]